MARLDIPRGLVITEPQTGHPTREFTRILDVLDGLTLANDAIADITTADATDEASAVTLTNDNKAKINEILAMLRTLTAISE
jgi:nucleoside-diphosphate-sugar epimerase